MFNKTFNKNAFLTREIKFKEINRSFDTVAKTYYIVLNAHNFIYISID